MKKINLIILTIVLLIGIISNAQTQIKKGSLTYGMTMPYASNESDAMETNFVTIHFDENNQATEISLMGGMTLIKTIVPTANKIDTKMTVEIVFTGSKYEITDVGEEGSKNDISRNIDEIKEIIYDKKDTKEIAGFKCYKATVTLNNGFKTVFYITETILPQVAITVNSKTKLKGMPLEMTIQSDEGPLELKATKFSKEVNANAFKIGEGFTKTTLEEFEKIMDGM